MIVANDEIWLHVEASLNTLEIEMDVLDKATDKLLIAPESPLKSPFYLVSDALISSLSLLVGDYFENISWFVYECDFGKKPMEGGVKGNMKLIDSFDRLRWLILLVSDDDA